MTEAQVLVAVVVLLQGGDWVTTYRVLKLGGREANPVMLRLAAWLSARGYSWHAWINVAKGAAVCAALLILCLPETPGLVWLLRALAAMYALIVINNLVVWRRQWLATRGSAGK